MTVLLLFIREKKAAVIILQMWAPQLRARFLLRFLSNILLLLK